MLHIIFKTTVTQKKFEKLHEPKALSEKRHKLFEKVRFYKKIPLFN